MEFGKQGSVCDRGDQVMKLQADPWVPFDVDHLKERGKFWQPKARAKFHVTVACLATDMSEGGILTHADQINCIVVHPPVRGVVAS